MTIGIRSNLVVSFKKKMTISFISFFFRYLCFTGISGNLAETPIFEGYFHFSSKWSLFSKSLVSSGDIKFSKRSIPCF